MTSFLSAVIAWKNAPRRLGRVTDLRDLLFARAEANEPLTREEMRLLAYALLDAWRAVQDDPRARAPSHAIVRIGPAVKLSVPCAICGHDAGLHATDGSGCKHDGPNDEGLDTPCSCAGFVHTLVSKGGSSDDNGW